MDRNESRGRRGRRKKNSRRGTVREYHGAEGDSYGLRRGSRSKFTEEDVDAYLSDRTEQGTDNLIDNIDHIISRRERILNFLYKDQYQLTHPDIRPFENIKHVYEYLLPYHIYNSPSYDDLLFMCSKENRHLMEEVRKVTTKVFTTLSSYDSAEDDNIVIDLLLTEEHKYFTGRLCEYLKEKKKRPRRTAPPRKRRKNNYVVKLNIKNLKPRETKVVLRLETQNEE